MHLIDYLIIFGYTLILLGLGFYFLRRQTKVDEYFVGDRKMGAGHIGFSVVATDVGGGFSIGLGGLGFTMGLSGSWLLFTGLVGAWSVAIVMVPTVKRLADRFKFLSYPDFLESRYDGKTRLVAAIVSALGYAGFVGGQILAGAKLSTAAFDVDLTTAVLIMAGVVIIYTSFGGIQAVIYTDTIQWFALLAGLLFLAVPLAYVEVGGWGALQESLPDEFFTLTNISLGEIFTWMFTIVPIWYVGMTIYQRIYATKDEKTAKRALYMAGILEWPLMSFLGVFLGMCARMLFPVVESEMGLPLLIKEILPVGIVGLVMAAYFSAIMSTADSCLLASTGNVVNDIYQKYIRPKAKDEEVLKVSRIASVVIGILSVSVALLIPKVLDAILLAYAFMVSGLFAPTLGGLISKRVSSRAALLSMAVGGCTAVLLEAIPAINPVALIAAATGLASLKEWTEPILLALPLSALALILGTLLWPRELPKGDSP